MAVPIDAQPGCEVFVVTNYRVGNYKMLCVTPCYVGYLTTAAGEMTYSSQSQCFMNLEEAWRGAGQDAMKTAARASEAAIQAFAEADKVRANGNQ